MTSFNVLSRTESVQRHLLLEASAGTGKTFSIENIIVRLLIEPGAKRVLLIENILVVTFTRMAASELKERIHTHLERCLFLLKRALEGDDVSENAPDYLLVPIEQGTEAVQRAKRHIERALFSFDRAQIFTIHGFCWRMLKSYALEAGMSPDASSSEDRTFSTAERKRVARDFLRGLSTSAYSCEQLKLLMDRADRDSEQLQEDLLKVFDRGIDIGPGIPFHASLASFQEAMTRLCNEFRFESQKMMEDFLTWAPSYKGLADKSKRLHPEKVAKAARFAALFDQKEWDGEDFDLLIRDGLFFVDAFDPELLKANAKPLARGALHYPNLTSLIRIRLGDLVNRARNKSALFSRLARDFQHFMRTYQERAEKFGHTDLLLQMGKAVGNVHFVEKVRGCYGAAIIDEFQDTDPIQWEIFSRLFSPKGFEWDGYLHLVGDPKQSIYAFRQADIYTYLAAAERLGESARASLDTNFRSQALLIDALNLMFSSAPGVFALPKLSHPLPYRDVRAGRDAKGSFNLPGPPLEFWQVNMASLSKKSLKAAESERFFPALSTEILCLKEQKGIGFGRMALLVSDKYQGGRAGDYLRAAGIPVKTQRGTHLGASSAIAEMRDLLNGMLNPYSKSALTVALAGRLIGMTHEELVGLEEEVCLLKVIEQCYQLRGRFFEFGFAAFYRAFMNSIWHEQGKTVLERLLQEAEGSGFYRQWQDLADLLIEEEQSLSLLPQGIVAFLDEVEGKDNLDEEKAKAYVDPDEEGVTIMTMHMSKGLEFDAVFALGLIDRKKVSEDALIPVERENKQLLDFVESRNEPHFRKFCEESDAEKMRQLYVALTRARERLYVPCVLEEGRKEIPIGSASPMELFLARLERPETDYAGVYDRVASENGTTLADFTAKFPKLMRLVPLDTTSRPREPRKKEKTESLTSPKDVCVPGLMLSIQSFTSLSHSKALEGDSASVGPVVPRDYANADKNEHTLPSGSETGIVLHRIFECIPFEILKEMQNPEELIPSISPYIAKTAFQGWEPVIAKIVFKSLKTELIGSGFCLADVDPKKIYRETEFLYPCDPDHRMLQGTLAKPGYLKGVVDLFFEYRGKFYLLDWKSNWLGPSDEDYHHSRLEEAMHANRYDLQAEIYTQAFQKYLKMFDKRPFEKIFGGVYYLFVRGVGRDTGVYKI